MKKIRIVALVAAIITFMCAYIMTRSTGDAGSGNASGGGTKISAVVVNQDIPPYTTLTADMLSLEQVETETPDTCFTSLEDAVGKVSVSDIFKGEVLSTRRVVNPDDAALGLSARIEDGKRAITILVDAEQGVGYNLKVGNYVDVVYRTQVDAGEVNGRSTPAGMAFTSTFGAGKPQNSAVMDENLDTYFSVITVQDVKVLAVDNTIAFSGTGSSEEYSHVTLEVTPAQAEDIALMNDAAGWIQLILRAQDDHTILSENRHSVLGE